MGRASFESAKICYIGRPSGERDNRHRSLLFLSFTVFFGTYFIALYYTPYASRCCSSPHASGRRWPSSGFQPGG